MLSATGESLSWYVVHTHPKQEDRTNINLQAYGIETVCPKFRANRYNEFSGQPIRVVKPLFPSYIFARFRYNDSYHRVRFARGVYGLVSFNNTPAPVDEEIIELIRSRIGSDGFVKPHEALKAGDEVVIKDGRFQNLCGVFEREMEDAERVSVLLNTVNFQAHVVVDRSLVNKVSQERRSKIA